MPEALIFNRIGYKRRAKASRKITGGYYGFKVCACKIDQLALKLQKFKNFGCNIRVV